MATEGGLAAAMNTRIHGSGNYTVVLAHGYGADQSVWGKVAPRLAARCRVLTFDWCFAGAVKDTSLFDAGRHGSYEGYAEDLISVLDEVKVEAAIFVGHSMAGMIGCIASIKRPDLFRRLVLVGSSPRYLQVFDGPTTDSSRLENAEDYDGAFALSDVEQIFSSIESDFEQWASSFASSVIDTADHHSVDLFSNSVKSMRRDVAMSMAKTVFLSDYRGILENIVVPCHIIQLRNDIVVPNSVAEYMQSKINGNCELVMINAEGHFPQLTAPDDFVEAMYGILES